MVCPYRAVEEKPADPNKEASRKNTTTKLILVCIEIFIG
jgi:hypothetical protein